MRLTDDFLPESRVAETSILTKNVVRHFLYSSVIGLLSNMFLVLLSAFHLFNINASRVFTP